MGTVPTPWTMGANGVLPSTSFNAGVRDPLRLLISPPLCVMRQTVAQSIPTATWTAILHDVHDTDRDGGHSTTTNTSRYTSQTAGWYHADMTLGWSSNNVGLRGIAFRVNGGTRSRKQQFAATTNFPDLTTSGIVFLGVGDYLEMVGYQDSGAALNAGIAEDQPAMQVLWVSS